MGCPRRGGACQSGQGGDTGATRSNRRLQGSRHVGLSIQSLTVGLQGVDTGRVSETALVNAAGRPWRAAGSRLSYRKTDLQEERKRRVRSFSDSILMYHLVGSPLGRDTGNDVEDQNCYTCRWLEAIGWVGAMRWRVAVSVVAGACTAHWVSSKEQRQSVVVDGPRVYFVDDREKYGLPCSHTKLDWENGKGEVDGWSSFRRKEDTINSCQQHGCHSVSSFLLNGGQTLRLLGKFTK